MSSFFFVLHTSLEPVDILLVTALVIALSVALQNAGNSTLNKRCQHNVRTADTLHASWPGAVLFLSAFIPARPTGYPTLFLVQIRFLVHGALRFDMRCHVS